MFVNEMTNIYYISKIYRDGEWSGENDHQVNGESDGIKKIQNMRKE